MRSRRGIMIWLSRNREVGAWELGKGVQFGRLEEGVISKRGARRGFTGIYEATWRQKARETFMSRDVLFSYNFIIVKGEKHSYSLYTPRTLKYLRAPQGSYMLILYRDLYRDRYRDLFNINVAVKVHNFTFYRFQSSFPSRPLPTVTSQIPLLIMTACGILPTLHMPSMGI